MGFGSFANGKFELNVTLMHSADAARLEQWRRSFARASEILFHATDGQMQFGKIWVSNDSRNVSAADALLYDVSGVAGSTTNYMLLYIEERLTPYILVHEFGHYMFELGDEYETVWGITSRCIANPLRQACIMEHGATHGDRLDLLGAITLGAVNEFCRPPDASTGPFHDSTIDNEQQTRNGKSCWESIKDKFTVNIPSTQRPFGVSSPSGHEPIDWQLTAAVDRLIVIVENTVVVTESPVFEGIQNGVRFLVDSFAKARTAFGLVSASGERLFELQPLGVGDNHRLALDVLTDLRPVEEANGQQALMTALGEITKQNQRASIQNVVRISRNTMSSLPVDELGRQYRSAGVRLIEVSLGGESPAASSQKLAEMTHGRVEWFEGPISAAMMKFAVACHFVRLVDELEGQSGILEDRLGALPDPGPRGGNEVPENRPHADSDSIKSQVRWNGFDLPVLVELGSQQVDFVVNLAEPGSAELTLLTPRGATLSPESLLANAEHIDREQWGYAIYRIPQPEPGTWFMRLRRKRVTGLVPFQLLARSHNPPLNIQFAAVPFANRRGVKFRLGVLYGGPLTGMEPPTVEIYRSGLGGELTNPRRDVALLRRPLHRLSPDFWMEIDGPYEGEIAVEQPGAYTVVARVANAGTAFRTVGETRNGEQRGLAPHFVRVIRQQLVIK